MTISTKDWVNYINKLAEINATAANKMREYVQKYGFGNTSELIQYAYAVTSKYGEAAAELTCQMYEATAEAQGMILPAAEAADTPTYAEVAKTVNGTINSPETMFNAIGRLTKRTGADTMLKNAERDGAEFAWVPHGDTCAFCIALASRGWQKMSNKALKNGHAEHIHANCDCQYAVRFDGKSNVAGYDPDKYLKMYNNAAPGKKPDEKIKALRAILTKENKKESLIEVTSEYLKKATPEIGNVSYEDGYQVFKHDEEIEISKWIKNTFGGRIVLQKERYDRQWADYVWNEKLWELKTTTTEKSVNSAVRKALKQIREKPGGIILDFKNNNIDQEMLKEVLEKRMKSSMKETDGIVDVIVKSKNVVVYRYKK